MSPSQRAHWTIRLALWFLRSPLADALGVVEARAVRLAAEAEIPPLLAALPKLPPRRAEATRFLTGVALLAGLYRALRAQGLASERAGGLVISCSRAALGRVPRPLRWLYRRHFFRPRNFRALAVSILGDPALGDGAPGDFQGALLEGAYGVDYTGCAIRSWLNAQDLADFAPWVCLLDDVQSEVFGLGLERSGTLAHGAPRCDFRFAPGRPGRPLSTPRRAP